tara:strand:+ start:37035 stop:37301 length:267 start_codon:yes stop_codon:yes gene_type:complete
MEDEIPVRDHYLNMVVLKSMNKFERDFYTYMYKKLIDYMLDPYDFSNHSRQSIEKSTQQIAVNHLYNSLREHGILVNIRELNIDKIIS